MRGIDIGCGSCCRLEICVDIDPTFSKPGTCHLNPSLPRVHDGDRDYVVASAELLPFRDDCADLAYLIHVLEHLECPIRALREALRIAERVLVIVPDPRTNDADWRDPTHIYSWTEAALRQLASRVGKVVEMGKLAEGQDTYALVER